jgi:hypothetical protein
MVMTNARNKKKFEINKINPFPRMSPIKKLANVKN